MAHFKDKVTIAQEEKYLTYGMVLFGDLPLGDLQGVSYNPISYQWSVQVSPNFYGTPLHVRIWFDQI